MRLKTNFYLIFTFPIQLCYNLKLVPFETPYTMQYRYHCVSMFTMKLSVLRSVIVLQENKADNKSHHIETQTLRIVLNGLYERRVQIPQNHSPFLPLNEEQTPDHKFGVCVFGLCAFWNSSIFHCLILFCKSDVSHHEIISLYS